jgi:hypothetical protein
MPPKATGPPSPHARHGERRLALRVIPPFVIDRGRDQAPAFGERLPEHAGCGHRLRLGVDRLARLLQILREVGDQAAPNTSTKRYPGEPDRLH